MTPPTSSSAPTPGSPGLVMPRATLVKRLIVGTLLINLFVIVLAGLWMSHARTQDQEEAEVITRNLSQVLEQYFVGAIGKIDLALLTVVDGHARQVAGGGIDARALNELLARQQAHLPEIISLRVADDRGIVKYGSGLTPGSPVNIADRDYFILARDDPQANLVISKPVFARISKKWAIVLARRLNQPDGSFAGIVYVNLALEHLNKIFYSIDVGAHGAVSLRDSEFGLIVRRPELGAVGSSIGQKAMSKKFNDMAQAGKTSGTYVAQAGIDNIERTFSFRKMSTPPYYIFVGLATEDYLAEWRSSAIKVLELVVVFVLVTLLSAWLLYRSWQRQQATLDALREQKDFLDTILENEPECVKVIATNGDLLQMNRAGLAMLEVDSILEAKKKGLLSFILPEYRGAFMALGKRVFSGESGVLEFPIEGKRGTRRWLDTHASPLCNARGEVVALVGVTRDITEHKQAEEALRASEERFRTVADYTYDWEYWEGAQRELLYMSPSCERITGYSPAEFMADPELLYRIVHPGDQRLMARHHDDAAHQDDGNLDFRIVRRDGGVCWIAHGCRAVYGADGRYMGRRANNRDITERKQAEEALSLLNETLEQRVQEGIAQNMGQERLLIQQSRLAAMGEMIGNIAHQWRQPINALNLLLANIKDAYEYNELDKEYLDREVGKGQQMIQKMSSTIDDFRNFFKPNKEKRSFLASDGVEEAIKLVEQSFKIHNVNIVFERGSEPRKAMGYPNEFAQVVLNALSNAKEAIAGKKIPGKIHVTVESGESTVTVAIRDNGGGIPEEILGKVFDPYFTTKEKGTGIGLYMSKMIMEHMDGEIVIGNIEGGAEVLLALPLVKEFAT